LLSDPGGFAFFVEDLLLTAEDLLGQRRQMREHKRFAEVWSALEADEERMRLLDLLLAHKKEERATK
jgi:hypothetical protein